ncbi:MAG: tetratricopeptide repeat protein [Myxococcales bacterium]|nr:tetratricopeptide repeat protein [Myxococcales bacterium]
MTSLIRSLAIELGLAALLFSAGAVAGGGVEGRARGKFEEANKAYDLGQFEEALKLYSDAYRVKALPGFLFNIGQCHRQLKQYDRAAFFYRRYLDVSTTRPANAATVEELIREMESKQSTPLPEGERERVGGAEELKTPVFSGEEPKPVDPPPLPAPAAEEVPALPPALAEPMAPPPEEKKESGSVLGKWWFWAAVGVLAVGAGATAVVAATPPPLPGEGSLGTLDLRNR